VQAGTTRIEFIYEAKMERKVKIAITGGIGSGKSTALSLVKELGFACFSCDEIYKEVQTKAEYIEKIYKRFPSAVVEGNIDKKILSNIVFHNPSDLEDLNKISHPYIMNALYKKMDEATSYLVFAEVPLLFEGGYQNNFDYVFIIERDLNDRIKSVQLRDGLSKDKIEDRIKNQFDYSSVYENSKTIKIKNCKSKEELFEILKDVISKIPMPL
jgi:dephospho-CoA kinase